VLRALEAAEVREFREGRREVAGGRVVDTRDQGLAVIAGELLADNETQRGWDPAEKEVGRSLGKDPGGDPLGLQGPPTQPAEVAEMEPRLEVPRAGRGR
jgi:hypothetical protein